MSLIKKNHVQRYIIYITNPNFRPKKTISCPKICILRKNLLYLHRNAIINYEFSIMNHRPLFLLLFCFLCFALQAQDQGKPFNGIITDLSGNPVKGAFVYTIDKDFRARTNKRGQFGLTNVQPTDTLHIVYKKVHYDIPVDGRRSMRIHLGDKFDAQEDEEIAELGYGYIKRREVLTPTNGISGDIIRRMGRPTIIQCLVGLVPGLNISPNGSVNIRGINSINLPTEPLYKVDDVTVSSLDMISPYDVDHVEVLKDASIYGAQGANGAILVYTIRGSK